MRRTCERVQARLPRLVDGSLPAWRRAVLERHLVRCDACGDELERQLAVVEELRELRDAADEPVAAPPDDLLDSILQRVHEPGLRERAASPARGAVSGARPELSLAAVGVAVLVTYLAWRLARRLVESHAAGRDAPSARSGR